MNTSGFLPLIEAFLAFALTMLALTTAVAAIVGVWQRLFRWRARGLRDTVEYLYRYSLKPQLERRGVHHETEGWDVARRQFIADMTIVPVPRIDNKNDGARDWRLESIAGSETATLWIFTPLRRKWLRWRSLRHGLDWLSNTEFRTRLAASEAGDEIAKRTNSKELINSIVEKFDTLGHAATETFARRSRVATIIFGFLLVIGVNIDSINLFNSYLSNPELRNQVIERQQDILAQADETPSARLTESIDQNGSEFDDALRQLTELTEKVSADIEAATDSDAIQEMRGVIEVAESVSSRLEQVRGELNDVREDSAEVSAAIADVRTIAVGVTQSFPVGWNQYPNCDRYSADSRCVILTTSGRLFGSDDASLPEIVVAADADGRPEADPPDPSTVSAITSPVALLWDRLASIQPALQPVYNADPAMFWRWFVGILLTGILVGLGTPFWVRAVNSALEARKLVQKGDRDESESESADAGSSAPQIVQVPMQSNQTSEPRAVVGDLDASMRIARNAADEAKKP